MDSGSQAFIMYTIICFRMEFISSVTPSEDDWFASDCDRFRL